MRVWTTSELFNLTRNELFALHAEIVTQLVDIPEGSYLRALGLANLARIRRVLARLRPTPG